MTLEEFQNSLANLIVRKDAINADLTRLMQQLNAHANALSSFADELSQDDVQEKTEESPEAVQESQE